MGEQLSEANRATIERVRKGLPGYPIFPADINEIMDAARSEGLHPESGGIKDKYISKIFTAELCFGLGWSAGYGSALKGSDGICMPQAMAECDLLKLVSAEPISSSKGEALPVVSEEMWTRIAEVVEANRLFVAAREAMNAAVPGIEATPAERALYQERYDADHKASRHKYEVAIRFAQDAGDILGRSLPRPASDKGEEAVRERSPYRNARELVTAYYGLKVSDCTAIREKLNLPRFNPALSDNDNRNSDLEQAKARGQLLDLARETALLSRGEG